jgi:hypothetical protein
MAYLVLTGAGGWVERWEIPPGEEDGVALELDHVGSKSTSRLTLVNPGGEERIELVVAWRAVAAAAIVPSIHTPLPGQYA